MGFLDGIFERKVCDICGQKCGILGGTKLKDGRLDKSCTEKLSPLIGYLKNYTVEDIKEHLAYREENMEQIRNFNVTHMLGGDGSKLYIDIDNRRFFVSGTDSWRSMNPDIISFDQIVEGDLNIVEDKREIKKKDEEGKEVSYNPKRYEYKYNFNVKITVNSKWFNSVNVKVNRSTIDGFDGDAYEDAYLYSEAICEVVNLMKDGSNEEIVEAIEYFKNRIAAPRRSYDVTYYADTKALRKGIEYYKQRDPRKSHYKF